MGKVLRDENGKFAGSVGDGHKDVPESVSDLIGDGYPGGENVSPETSSTDFIAEAYERFSNRDEDEEEYEVTCEDCKNGKHGEGDASGSCGCCGAHVTDPGPGPYVIQKVSDRDHFGEDCKRCEQGEHVPDNRGRCVCCGEFTGPPPKGGPKKSAAAAIKHPKEEKKVPVANSYGTENGDQKPKHRRAEEQGEKYRIGDERGVPAQPKTEGESGTRWSAPTGTRPARSVNQILEEMKTNTASLSQSVGGADFARHWNRQVALEKEAEAAGYRDRGQSPSQSFANGDAVLRITRQRGNLANALSQYDGDREHPEVKAEMNRLREEEDEARDRGVPTEVILAARAASPILVSRRGGGSRFSR